MKTSKDTKINNRIREKIDGFTLSNSGDSSLQNRYITTDQGVYSQPDDNYETHGKEKD